MREGSLSSAISNSLLRRWIWMKVRSKRVWFRTFWLNFNDWCSQYIISPLLMGSFSSRNWDLFIIGNREALPLNSTSSCSYDDSSSVYFILINFSSSSISSIFSLIEIDVLRSWLVWLKSFSVAVSAVYSSMIGFLCHQQAKAKLL